MLLTFALAYWIKKDETFLKKVEEGVSLLLQEPSWCLPAHNTYVRDAPPLPQPDPERPVIDLFAAETGATLSIVQSLVPLSSDLHESLEKALEKRIRKLYLTSHFWWMGEGDEPMCNWTPWCTSNVLLTFFLSASSREEEVKEKAISSLRCFLKDVGEDGAYKEGVEYWNHAALPLLVSLFLLRQMGCAAAEKMHNHPKVKALFSFPNAMRCGSWFLNWGDCSAKAEVGDARMLLMEHPFLWQGKGGEDSAHDGLVRYLSLSCARQNIHPLPLPSFRYYPSACLAVWHKDGWDMGIRAGKNGFSHQHNDLGSLTIYRDGDPWLIDAGVETYTKKTFNEERYTIWTMRSPWHNTVNPKGDEQTSSDTAEMIRADEQGAVVSLSRLHWKRTVRLGAQIEVEDECPPLSTLTLLSQTKPSVEEGVVFYPGLGRILFGGMGQWTLEEIPVTDHRLSKAWKGSLWRLLVSGGPFSWTIEPKCGR